MTDKEFLESEEAKRIRKDLTEMTAAYYRVFPPIITFFTNGNYKINNELIHLK